MLLEEQPGATPQAVRDKLAETDAMTALLIKNGTPRFDRVENVKNVVNRACKGRACSLWPSFWSLRAPCAIFES